MADLTVTVSVILDGEIIATGTNVGYSSAHTVEGLLPGALRSARSGAHVRAQRDKAERQFRVLYGHEND